MKTLRELLSNYANHQSANPSPLPLLMAIVDRLEPLRPPTVREQMADLFGLDLRTSREPLLRALTAERDAAVKERDAIHTKLNAAREALR